jgi:2-polyprenyl-3-methyl-5-hydroxy-6-metoxy-1,4-benzoquinol methylase
LNGVPISFKKPTILGNIEFQDSVFDLIVCLGTLHHIPNVSKIIKELYRVAKPGGITIIREPIISMGDWRSARKGLTKRERGIPKDIFQKMITDAGFKVVKRKYCFSPVTTHAGLLMKSSVYNKACFVLMDEVISNLFSKNIRYHRTKKLENLAPISVFYVLTKE